MWSNSSKILDRVKKMNESKKISKIMKWNLNASKSFEDNKYTNIDREHKSLTD